MEEKKNKKNTILSILLIICIIAIAVMGFFIYKLNKAKMAESAKNDALQEQLNTLSENSNKLQEKIDTISNTINPTNTSTISKTNTSTNTNNASLSKVDNLKQYLKDTNWLKQNVYIQKSEEQNNSDLSDQIAKFIYLKDTQAPSVVIIVSSENARMTKTLLVSYSDSIKVEEISQGHIAHGDTVVDSDKNLVIVSYTHMGYDERWVYKIQSGQVQFVGGYGVYEDNNTYHIKESKTDKKEVSKEEYEAKKNELNVEHYSSQSYIELTNSNINTYIK